MAKALVETFVEVLEEAGVGKEQRTRLHQVFERKDPAAHEAFLRALGLDDQHVREVRERSR